MTRQKYGTPKKGDEIRNGTQSPATETIRSVPAESQEAKLALGLRTTRTYLLRISGDLGVSIPENKMDPISEAIKMLGKIERKEMPKKSGARNEWDSPEDFLNIIYVRAARATMTNAMRKLDSGKLGRRLKCTPMRVIDSFIEPARPILKNWGP